MQTNLLCPLPIFDGRSIDREVGKRLRELRVSRDVTVSFIAKALELSGTLVTSWEEGFYRIPAHQLVALATLFSCPLMVFFEGVEST